MALDCATEKRRVEGDEAVVVVKASRQVDVRSRSIGSGIDAVEVLPRRGKQGEEGRTIGYKEMGFFFYGLLGKNEREGNMDLFVCDVYWLWEEKRKKGRVGCGWEREIEKERRYCRWGLRVEENRGRRQ